MIEPISLPSDQVRDNDAPPVAQKAGFRKDGPTDISGRVAGFWFFSIFEYGRKLAINAIIVGAIVAGILVIGKATLSRSVVFEPIGIPKELSERGFTGEATAKQIVDELTILWNNAETSKRLGIVGTMGSQTATPKIEVPGTGISIDTIVYYLRNLLGRVDTKISGEITVNDRKIGDSEETKHQASSPKYNLRLRIVDRGFVYLESEPTNDLRVLFKRAALPLMEQIDPYIAGLTYRQQKDFIAAIRMAKLQLRSGTIEDQQWAHSLLASIAQDQKRTDIAKDEFTKLGERFPRFALPHYNLGHLLFLRGDYQESMKGSLKGAQVDENVERRAIGYGNVAAALNEMRKKEIEFDHWDASADEVLRGLGEIIKDDRLLASIRKGGIPDVDLIIALCRVSTEHDPTHSAAYRTWGGVERDRKNFVEAMSLFERSIAAKPREPFGYRDMGGLYISERDWNNAAVFFQKAVDINPDSYSDHHNLGRSLGEIGKYDLAVTEFRAALRINPKYAWSHLRWAQMLARKANEQTGDAAKSTRLDAVEHLKTASRLIPDNSAMTSQVAATYEALGMVADAAAEYVKKGGD